MSKSKAWLSEVKAGDSVACTNGYMGGISVAKVDKVTATQIVCGVRRFNRETGYLIGYNGYHRPQLIEFTQEVKDRVRADEVSSSLHNILRGKDNVPLLLFLGEALDAYKSKSCIERKGETE